MLLLQIATAGIATGSVYALIAIGIVLIYKCSGVVNFGQGGYVMLGAYAAYALTRLGLSPQLAAAGAVLILAAVGALTELLVLRRMLKAPVVAVMMVTLGLLILFRAVCLAIFGPDQIAFPQIFPQGAVDIAGIFITYNYVAAAVLSLVLSLAFLAFYRYTPMGLMQRAAADNSRAALAVGIHVSNQVSVAWAVSSALAGLGGVLLATLNSLSLTLSSIGLVAFPVIVLGGLTSLMGSLVAGLLLGMLEAFTDGLLTPALESFLRAHTSVYSVGALQQVVPYMLVGAMLLVRPQGIFGQRGTERV
ncbi:MAG: branched-chain amino acid ABC transporter permease [Deltaproteobacteria bacterium]|nr:branched-chain amino acid ABC transporter permease [Deltaproteobacteria bacterium]